jgi:exopolysaccharide production protein ExoQ
MVGQIMVWITVFFAIWAIKRDTARREGISPALWIPTLWAGILCSRPVSAWLNGRFLERSEYVGGSPIDMLFYLTCIVAASIIVLNRRPAWSTFLSRNWPIVLFYLYLLVSVLWAESPFDSSKRWFKEVGNIMVAMVILTEANPQQAFKAVFLRCAYLFFPLSYVFFRWFSGLGRIYPHHGGLLEVIGVSDQKNNLGAMLMICCLVIVWDLLDNIKSARNKRDRVGLRLRVGILFLGLYLLFLCDSKTSMICLALGGGILATTRVPALRKWVAHFSPWILGFIVLFNLSDAFLEIKEALVEGLGRDMTFTERTDIWQFVMQMHTDPLFGAGYDSFWTDQHYLSQVPEGMPLSAHNGYLELYIDGGYIAVALLILLLVVAALRIKKQMISGGMYPFVCYAVLVMAVVANFYESYFARMTSLGFIFLLTAVGDPRRQRIPLGARKLFFGSLPPVGTPGSATPDSER